jgi:hypothetical protein
MRAIAGSILATTFARGATAAMHPKNGANQPLDMSSETRIPRKCILKIITYEGLFQFNERKHYAVKQRRKINTPVEQQRKKEEIPNVPGQARKTKAFTWIVTKSN